MLAERQLGQTRTFSKNFLLKIPTSQSFSTSCLAAFESPSITPSTSGYRTVCAGSKTGTTSIISPLTNLLSNSWTLESWYSNNLSLDVTMLTPVLLGDSIFEVDDADPVVKYSQVVPALCPSPYRNQYGCVGARFVLEPSWLILQAIPALGVEFLRGFQ